MSFEETLNILNSYEPSTKVRALVKGKISKCANNKNAFYFNDGIAIFICEYSILKEYIQINAEYIEDYDISFNMRNSKMDLYNYLEADIRVEPGSVIRDNVELGNKCVILMGAVINVGAKVGENTMIDMNAVLGARAEIGSNCHIGAGSVIAGVLEPPSKVPVRIGDNVLIGANSVILEGIQIGNNAIIGAGSIVTKDVEPYTVVVGNPARYLKDVDFELIEKNSIVNELR